MITILLSEIEIECKSFQLEHIIASQSLLKAALPKKTIRIERKMSKPCLYMAEEIANLTPLCFSS